MRYKCKLCNIVINGRYKIEIHIRKEHGIGNGTIETIESDSLPKRKPYKCPNCGKEMSYANKYFHQQNAKKYCINP